MTKFTFQSAVWMSRAVTLFSQPLPTFQSLRELQLTAPQWAAYLERVYGNLDAISSWPLNLSATLRFVYSDVPLPTWDNHMVPMLGMGPACGVRSSNGTMRAACDPAVPQETLLRVDGKRGRHKLYTGRRYGDVFKLYHPPYPPEATTTMWVYPYSDIDKSMSMELEHVQGAPSGTRIEAFHCAENNNQSSFWLYHAPGSGVFFDVGRTFVARNRCTLWAALNLTVSVSPRGKAARCQVHRHAWHGHAYIKDAQVPHTTFASLRMEHCPGFWCSSGYELQHQQYLLTKEAMERLVERGFDSLQLTHTEEHKIFKHEIVDLRQPWARRSGTRTATSADTSADTLGNRRDIQRYRRVTLDAKVDEPARACPRAHARHAYVQGWGGRLPCRCEERVSGQHPGCIRCARTVPLKPVHSPSEMFSARPRINHASFV